jgi:hypothetical protein
MYHQKPKLSPQSSVKSRLPRVCIQSLLCLALLVVVGGCFEKTYTDRMKTTVEFYTHKDKLNRNLLPDWTGTGYKIRVPVGFDFIPPPEPKPVDPENPEPKKGKVKVEELHDPRQPEFLGFRLPGLVAAWQKDVNVDEANGNSVVKKAHFFLLSNTTLFSVAPDAPGRIEPLKFYDYVANTLIADIMTPVKEDDWREDVYPTDTALVPKVSYRATTLSPERLLEGTKMTFKISIHAEGSTQTVLLLIYPTETSSSERLTDRFNYSLETLRVPSEPQQATSPGGGGGTAAPGF